MQRALLQWKRPEKRGLVLEALRLTGRTDLIGWGKQCLLHPEGRTEKRNGNVSGGKTRSGTPVTREKTRKTHAAKPTGRKRK